MYRKIVHLSDTRRPFAAALVLKAEGSTPQKVGARAVIEGSGRIWGTVGGGQVEAEAVRCAVEACQTKRAVVFDFYLEGRDAGANGPICGGAMSVLVDPTAGKDRAAYAQAAEAIEQRRRGVLLTTIRTRARPTDFVALGSGEAVGRREAAGAQTTARWIAEADVLSEAGFPGAETIRSSVDSQTPQLLVKEISEPQGEFIEVLIEPIIPKPHALIVGGGHIGQALAHQAVLIDFDVTVIDDRPEFTNPALFPPGVQVRCGDTGKEVADFPLSDDIYVVIVTRGHKHDAEALAACIHRPAAYVGMIGSQRKVALMRKRFVEGGLASAEEFDLVCAPIGLDIGALTVAEIAMSIAAQLIAVRRKGHCGGSWFAGGPPQGCEAGKDARKRELHNE